MKDININDFKKFLEEADENRKKEYKRRNDIIKDTKKVIRNIENKHNIKFEEFPIELQAILMFGLNGQVFYAGKKFYEDFKNKYPEFSYLL